MKVYTILKNLWKSARSYSDSNLQTAKAYTDSKTAELTDSGWKELSTYVQYRRKNGVVYITGRSAGGQSLPASTYVTLGTLPDGYRPSQEVRIGSDTSGGNYQILAAVTSGGLVRIWASSANAYWDIFGSFPVGG